MSHCTMLYRTFLFVEAVLFILEVLVNPDQRRDSRNTSPLHRTAAAYWKQLLKMQMTQNLILQKSFNTAAANVRSFERTAARCSRC